MALAEHAVALAHPSGGGPYKIQRITLKLGEDLNPGQTSASGAYAIVDRRKGKILRVALRREIAEVLAGDYQSRKVQEAYMAHSSTG